MEPPAPRLLEFPKVGVDAYMAGDVEKMRDEQYALRTAVHSLEHATERNREDDAELHHQMGKVMKYELRSEWTAMLDPLQKALGDQQAQLDASQARTVTKEVRATTQKLRPWS
eukprot:SAG31_NODE_3347_length_4368_cov_3.037643_1_plen_113_part_00